MYCYFLILAMFLGAASVAAAAPVIELEIAAESGLQITAPQQWLQLLTSIGLENVRIRGLQASDEPAVENRGTAERPRYHVVAILTAREQLQVPGGAFGRSDGKRLKDYFDRLSADGAERLTAHRTLFGLTEAELRSVLADLSQPIDFATKGESPRAIADRLQAKFKQRLAFDATAEATLPMAKPVADELTGLSAGTGLAIMLRSYGLVLRPQKLRGQPIVYRIAAQSVASAQGDDPRPGKLNDFARTTWPIGWETEKSPGESAPSLFEQLNVEIAGFTLEETLAAIGPRLKIPYFVDHAALTARKIDPKAVQITVEKIRISYKRLLDRVLGQARLGCDLRVDEAGLVFLWIGR
jgi:hypothetical protein